MLGFLLINSSGTFLTLLTPFIYQYVYSVLEKKLNNKQCKYLLLLSTKKVREKCKECHNHKPEPFPDPMRKRKQTKPNKRKSNKCTKSTKISSLLPKRGNRNAKRTEKHKNKITKDKT